MGGGRRESSYDNRPPSRQYVVNSADEAAGNGNGRGERGRSLPPGANIDSMRDFYKSSQFKVSRITSMDTVYFPITLILESSKIYIYMITQI